MILKVTDGHGLRALQEKGITGILNGVEDIVKPDNDELGLEVLYDATSLEKKLEVKAMMQEAQVPHPAPSSSHNPTRCCLRPRTPRSLARIPLCCIHVTGWCCALSLATHIRRDARAN